MEDKMIVDLYWERSEAAIVETEKKYGKYCYTIAYNILGNAMDSQECVNDTYLKVWQTIPPARPNRLSVFIGKLTRNISLNRLRMLNTKKRSVETEVIFDEIDSMISDPMTDIHDSIFLKNTISSFVDGLSKRDRRIFIQRYWYMYPSAEIAKEHGVSDSFVRVKLFRLREDFKKYLEKEGIEI